MQRILEKLNRIHIKYSMKIVIKNKTKVISFSRSDNEETNITIENDNVEAAMIFRYLMELFKNDGHGISESKSKICIAKQTFNNQDVAFKN